MYYFCNNNNNSNNKAYMPKLLFADERRKTDAHWPLNFNFVSILDTVRSSISVAERYCSHATSLTGAAAGVLSSARLTCHHVELRRWRFWQRRSLPADDDRSCNVKSLISAYHHLHHNHHHQQQQQRRWGIDVKTCSPGGAKAIEVYSYDTVRSYCSTSA